MKAGPARQVGLTTALDVISGKWKVLILCELRSANRRFGELRRLLPGVSEKVLIQQLREMDAAGIVDRHVVAEVPPKVTYSLTYYGVSLHEALGPLGAWGNEHLWRTETEIREPQAASVS